MRRFFTTAIFCLFVLLLTLQESPAPIVEVTPTPAARAAKSRSNSKKEQPAKKPTQSKPIISSFAGTWSGSVLASFASDVGLNTSGNALRTVKISSDGSVVYFGQSGGQVGPTSYSRVIVSKDGRGVSWTNQQNEQGGVSRGTFSLQLIGPNAANYQENASFSSNVGNGTIKASGTLTKQ